MNRTVKILIVALVVLCNIVLWGVFLFWEQQPQKATEASSVLPADEHPMKMAMPPPPPGPEKKHAHGSGGVVKSEKAAKIVSIWLPVIFSVLTGIPSVVLAWYGMIRKAREKMVFYSSTPEQEHTIPKGTFISSGRDETYETVEAGRIIPPATSVKIKVRKVKS